MFDSMNENFATKADFKLLETNLRGEMRELEYRMTIKLGTMMTVGFGIMTALLTILIKVIPPARY